MLINCVARRLPDNVTLEQAALAEPLSVLIHASRRTGLSPSPDSVHSPSSSSTSLSRSGNADKSVLVFGCGAIGLLACALAKARGVRRVVALDINERRLAFARECGWADDVFCLPPPSSQSREKEQANPKQVADERLRRSKASIEEALKHFGQPDGFDVVYECSGAEACIQMSVYVSICASFIVPSHLPIPFYLFTIAALHMSGCLLSFLLVGMCARRESDAHRDGLADRDTAAGRGRDARGRPPWILPLRGYVRRGPVPALWEWQEWRGAATGRRGAARNAQVQACGHASRVRGHAEGPGREGERGH